MSKESESIFRIKTFFHPLFIQQQQIQSLHHVNLRRTFDKINKI